MKNNISPFFLSTNFNENYVLAPVLVIVHPVFAYQDCGGIENSFFTVLPKHNWAQYFYDRIDVETEIEELLNSDEDSNEYNEEDNKLSDDNVHDKDNEN